MQNKLARNMYLIAGILFLGASVGFFIADMKVLGFAFIALSLAFITIGIVFIVKK